MEAAAVTINIIGLGIIAVFCLGVLVGYKLRKSQRGGKYFSKGA